MDDRHRAREISEEDDARFERGDEQGLVALVIVRDLPAQLFYALGDRVRAEVDIADAGIEVQAS
jgi:hypothetical protein